VVIARAERHTSALKAALEATGLKVGVSRAPEPWVFPYVVLWPHGVVLDGPIANHNADAVYTVTVHCVGQLALQAEWLQDEVAEVVLAGPPIPGRAHQFPPDILHHTAARRDDDTTPELFLCVSVYRFFTTPA
jgi:hypothetical protein